MIGDGALHKHVLFDFGARTGESSRNAMVLGGCAESPVSDVRRSMR